MIRDCPGLLTGATNIFERALSALNRHFDRDGVSATVGAWEAEFTFGFRMHGALPVAMATAIPIRGDHMPGTD